MEKLLIGSNNINKIKEIETIFKLNNVTFDIVTPKELGCFDEPTENGNSFSENAIIKTKFYYNLYHLPCIGEDSGICIDYFGGRPGIYSKRFLSDLNDKDKNDYILKLMDGIKNRKASFHDVLCYINSKGEIRTFDGINYGEISIEQIGDEGFGYDPIFLIPEYNKTEAQLGTDYKNEYSHRAIALKKFIDFYKNENIKDH